jgi:hypothetical protein
LIYFFLSSASFTNYFISENDQQDVLANGWSNDYTLYLSPNTVINNGLTLTLSNINCPAGKQPKEKEGKRRKRKQERKRKFMVQLRNFIQAASDGYVRSLRRFTVGKEKALLFFDFTTIHPFFLIDCGGYNYSGAGWTSVEAYSYGTYSFMAQSTSISGIYPLPLSYFSPSLSFSISLFFLFFFFIQGTGLSLVAAGNTSTLEQIAYVFSGSTPTAVNVSVWHNGWQSPEYTIQLPFDASQVRGG